MQLKIMELRGTYKGGGGPDKTILLSALAHDDRKFYVLVTYLRDPKDDDFQIGKLALGMGILHYTEVLDRCMLDFNCLLTLNRLVKKHEIQIIHVHDLKTTLLGVLLKALNPRVKIMHTAHGWIVNTREDKIKQRLQFLMLKLYPFHIAVSKATKNLMVENGILAKRIRVLYNSIDINYWKNDNCPTIRSEFNVPGDSFVVGTVGRLSKEKDLPTFFAVAKKLLTKNPNIYFMVIGDGQKDLVDTLHKLAETEGIKDSIIFTGHRTDLKNFYTSFDLFLSTSVTEGLPNTILEAMAMEIPIVATAVGGVPELIEHQKSGILSAPKDVDGLSAAVLHLMKDREKCKSFAVSGRANIENNFSFSHRLKIIENYYCKFVNKS